MLTLVTTNKKMNNIKININNTEIEACDYRNVVQDYRIFSHIDFTQSKPTFIPLVDNSFFASQGFIIPAIKVEDLGYLFPTNSKNTSKYCTLSDFIDFCIVDLDILVVTQNYYYSIAKKEYDKKPKIGVKYMYIDGKFTDVEYIRKFRKRGSNGMTWVQYNLSKLFYIEKEIWTKHRELQEDTTFKKIDIKLAAEELESVYSKGEQTSYGLNNSVNDLVLKFGVKVKLQNGKPIGEVEVGKIKNFLMSFFASYKNLSAIFRDYGLIISYSKEKHMHAQNALGIFSSQFKAIGVSDIKDFDRNFSHELGHLIDYLLGEKIKRNYASDDRNHVCGQIAALFRKNMIKRQTSEYKNRSKECFARAIEQFYSTRNNIHIKEAESHFCNPVKFEELIVPLVLKLKNFL